MAPHQYEHGERQKVKKLRINRQAFFRHDVVPFSQGGAAELADDLAGELDAAQQNQQAEAEEQRVRADAKARKEAAKAGDEANKEKREAEYEVAKEKCDSLSAAAKDSCLAEAKARFKGGT